MLKQVSVAVLCACLPALGASFECAKAKTPIESAICGNPNVDGLDATLGQLFKDKKSYCGRELSASIIAEQRNWIYSRNARWSSHPDSLWSIYRERVEACQKEEYRSILPGIRPSVIPMVWPGWRSIPNPGKNSVC